MFNVGKVRTNVYLNKKCREKAQKVFRQCGLTLSEGLNLFLAIVAETGTLPFEFKLPNKTTKKVIKEVLQGRNIEETSLKEVLSEIKKA